MRKLEALKKSADAELAAAEKALAAATDQTKAKAEEREAEGRLEGRGDGAQLDKAKADAKPRLDAIAAAKDTAKAAETKKAATAKAALDAKLAVVPVSIYISRATQKLYVRRNTHKPFPTAAKCSISASRRRSRSAIPRSKSARMCSPRWRARTQAFAGAR